MTDWVWILAVAVGVGAALALFRVESAFDRLMEARDAAGERSFPRVRFTERGGSSPSGAEQDARAFAGLRLPPGGTCTVWLHARELEEGDCRSLAVLDDRGRSWPVSGEFRAVRV